MIIFFFLSEIMFKVIKLVLDITVEIRVNQKESLPVAMPYLVFAGYVK